MTQLATLLLLFVTQSLQDDSDKWQRETVTPIKTRIESKLDSDAKREWLEGKYHRIRGFIHGGDTLLLAGSEFHSKEAKVAPSVGATSYEEGILTLIHRGRTVEDPEVKETYMPIRWGKEVVLLYDNEYELHYFINAFNSGEFTKLTTFYATTHSDLSPTEIPQLPVPFREKLFVEPFEFTISEVIAQQGTHHASTISRPIIGARIKAKAPGHKKPFVDMQVFAVQPNIYARGYVVAIHGDECEILIEKQSHDPDLKVGEVLTAKKPHALLNSQILWRQLPDRDADFGVRPSDEHFFSQTSQEPSQKLLLEWLSDDNRWAIAHILLVKRILPGAALKTKRTPTGWEVEFAGLHLSLEPYKTEPLPKAGEKIDLSADYGDIKAQQKKLREFWSAKLSEEKK